MTQTATVTALPTTPGGLVELTVVRQTACGHSCDGCGRCAGRTPDLVIRAACGFPVQIGDKVESRGGTPAAGLGSCWGCALP